MMCASCKNTGTVWAPGNDASPGYAVECPSCVLDRANDQSEKDDAAREAQEDQWRQGMDRWLP